MLSPPERREHASRPGRESMPPDAMPMSEMFQNHRNWDATRATRKNGMN
jgi:hypothetical protein